MKKISHIKGRRGSIFMYIGEWNFEFDYEKTRCTACGSKIPHLDVTTLTGNKHICLCNRCDNLLLDDMLNIEGLGHLNINSIQGLEHHIIN